ncbi:MAG: DNA mismatch repair endonuclease MutL [Acidobacteria bacterium]|nr:DNA mismatch repair endonuclease MutL [Acidobacteriota bacterium]
MARIHRLPLHLANQIAAGEVIERPASVVKELIENALDAGAGRISINVELGGKKLIRVDDDGDGMEPKDARLAIERHATSKIGRPEDLAAICTLGFRGEALPSIASVSHFALRTRARGTAAGTEIRVNGGAVSSVQEVGVPEGTCVEVAELFYNLPARRKFLKSDTAESTQISRLVTQMALGYPEVGFSLTSGGRKLVECPPAAGPGERFFQLFGERPDLIEVRKEASGLKVHGYVAALGEQGPVRGAQHVFVNRRIVKDRTIAHAIADAYSVATIKEGREGPPSFSSHHQRRDLTSRSRWPFQVCSRGPRSGAVGYHRCRRAHLQRHRLQLGTLTRCWTALTLGHRSVPPRTRTFAR